MPNFGGFSWKRLTGITKVKSKISRATGIPMTRSGRQRKIGKALGGCVLPISILLVSAVALAVMR